MHVVLINGPAEAGKNTLAAQTRIELFKILNESNLKPKTLAWRIGVEEFKQPLIDMLYAFAESLSVIDLGATRSPTLYEELKKEVMLGQTGRQWQITWADAMRAVKPDVFVEFLTRKIENMQLDVALVPDCGFPDELLGHKSVLLNTVVYLDGWKDNKRIYSHGEQFENDIRICLRGDADIVNPHPHELAMYIYSKMSQRLSDLAQLTA